MSDGPLDVPLKFDGELAFHLQSGKKSTKIEWKATPDRKGSGDFLG